MVRGSNLMQEWRLLNNWFLLSRPKRTWRGLEAEGSISGLTSLRFVPISVFALARREVGSPARAMEWPGALPYTRIALAFAGGQRFGQIRSNHIGPPAKHAKAYNGNAFGLNQQSSPPHETLTHTCVTIRQTVSIYLLTSLSTISEVSSSFSRSGGYSPIRDRFIPQSDLMLPCSAKMLHKVIAENLSSNTPLPHHLRGCLLQGFG